MYCMYAFSALTLLGHFGGRFLPHVRGTTSLRMSRLLSGCPHSASY